MHCRCCLAAGDERKLRHSSNSGSTCVPVKTFTRGEPHVIAAISLLMALLYTTIAISYPSGEMSETVVQGTLRDCMQHMRSHYWRPIEPQPPPAAADAGMLASLEADCVSESADTMQITPATLSLHARAGDAPAASQQRALRRSSRLQQFKAVRSTGEGLTVARGTHEVHSSACAQESGSPSVRSSATVFPGSSGRDVAAFSPSEPSNKERSQSVSWPSCP